MKKIQKGFTLIELMVVISIIGFLSSIVLVSLKDARDKANLTKFRSEINQLVIALELYNNTNGTYPYEIRYSQGQFYSYTKRNDNSERIDSGGGAVGLNVILKDYIKDTPNVPNNSFGAILSAYQYRTNVIPTYHKCVGDSTLPKYVILIQNTNPTLFNYFSDWPYDSASSDKISWTPNKTARCFSAK